MASYPISSPVKVGVVGATGIVGKSFIRSLAERQFPVAELRLFASENSVGKSIAFAGRDVAVSGLGHDCFAGLDIVFFSSGDDISRDWAPKAVAAGAWAIDNSAAFRMDERYPLVVPEVNGDLLAGFRQPTIIANPNCSTIQLVVALNPIQKAFGLRSVFVSTYQSVSGAGQPGCDELNQQLRDSVEGKPLAAKTFKHPILTNCIPEIGSLSDGGFFTEELKVIRETRKIMRSPQLKVSCMAVRVPVQVSHAEVVRIEIDKPASRDEIVKALEGAAGLELQDAPERSYYPLQSEAAGKDPVFVGRLHQDLDDPRVWLMWVVADNVKKGAALNGIQIAETLLES